MTLFYLKSQTGDLKEYFTDTGHQSKTVKSMSDVSYRVAFPGKFISVNERLNAKNVSPLKLKHV